MTDSGEIVPGYHTDIPQETQESILDILRSMYQDCQLYDDDFFTGEENDDFEAQHLVIPREDDSIVYARVKTYDDGAWPTIDESKGERVIEIADETTSEPDELLQIFQHVAERAPENSVIIWETPDPGLLAVVHQHLIEEGLTPHEPSLQDNMQINVMDFLDASGDPETVSVAGAAMTHQVLEGYNGLVIPTRVCWKYREAFIDTEHRENVVSIVKDVLDDHENATWNEEDQAIELESMEVEEFYTILDGIIERILEEIEGAQGSTDETKLYRLAMKK